VRWKPTTIILKAAGHCLPYIMGNRQNRASSRFRTGKMPVPPRLFLT